ncbi:MAG: cytochrome C biosynthesis protein [Phycisphaerae bacterium]
MTRRARYILATVLAAAVVAAGVLAWALGGRGGPIRDATEAGRPARIHPDYAGVTIPPNIAPMNFVVDEPAREVRARLTAGRGGAIEVKGRDGGIVIPPSAWRMMLDANKGGELSIDIFARGHDGRWTHFDTVRNLISTDAVDDVLVYRLLDPVFNIWQDMGIYQRDLRSFDESAVVTNRNLATACMNCHTFNRNSPDPMVLHSRLGSGQFQGPAMILAQGGKAAKIDTRQGGASSPASYIAWHPGGRLLAFSTNNLKQFFHTTGPDVREVVDLNSDLAVYSLDTGKVSTTPKISRPEALETFPMWSPKGDYLYFCSAPALWWDRTVRIPYDKYKDVRYSVMRIKYDAAAYTWGEVETVLSAADTKLSASELRFSPDGRFLLMSMSDYGSFPIYRPGTAIWIMDMQTKKARPVDEINSGRCDSWHCWSSSGRWVVFSSKRDNGLLARPYFSHVDEKGNFTKPFALPQEDPRHYDRFLLTYNLPELVTGRVTVGRKALEDAINTPQAVTGATPRTAASGPAQSSEGPWKAN